MGGRTSGGRHTRRLGRRRDQDRAAERRPASAASVPGPTGSSASPPFELDNRNKRSIALNLAVAEGRDIAARLVDEADVFVTNARAGCARPGRPRLRDGVGAQPPARVRPRHRVRPRGRGARSRRVRRGRVLVACGRRRGADTRRRRPSLPARWDGRPHGGPRRGGCGVRRAVRPSADRHRSTGFGLAAAHRAVHARLGRQHGRAHGYADHSRCRRRHHPTR